MNSAGAIAIVGMSGRWPGARNIGEFWSNLCAGTESIRPFTQEELAAEGFDPAIMQQPGFVNAGAPLADALMFDAALFGISHREAQSLDPQHRVFLECAWHALEDAGAVPERLDGPVGIFAGSSFSSYIHRVQAAPDIVAAVGSYQVMIGNDKDHLTTYTAYKLNLTGPAITVQTACSTSLVAAALACQSLQSLECDLALAGGVSVRLPQHAGYFHEEGGILSPDGHCRAFDRAAKGTVGGNGAGVVVLKRLADAVRDRDRIHAVILGAAMNNDGAVKVGYTAPSADGQGAVIATAMALAGVEPETVGYVETHGTGTPLGDPIEIAGLTQAFGNTRKKGFCAIGSVKTNIGHLDAAAGVTGLIKAALCVRRGILPPSLHFEKPNPAIDFAQSPFRVQSQLAAWEDSLSAESPRRAGVSSFGIGGTNAHLVLEEAPPHEPSGPSREWQILPLCARSEAALEKVAAHLDAELTGDLADAAFTLATGRRSLPCRRAMICPASNFSAREVYSATASERSAPVFLFPGQGSQHAGMGRELYDNELLFREEFDRCAVFLEPLLGVDIRREIFDAGASDERLRQTWLAQPSLFAYEYSLARLLMSWGILPAAMIGHSLGEYVAACLAGVFSPEDALTLVAARGMLMQDTAPGAMLATALGEEELSALLPPGAEIAAVNGPVQTVVSGSEAALAALQKLGIPCVRLRASHAFHSRTMDPVLEPFRTLLESVTLRPPTLPYVSNLTGAWQGEAAADPAYWVDHLRRAVRFGEGSRALLHAGYGTFVEAGPGRTLSRLLQDAGAEIVIETGRDQKSLAVAVGRLWTHGVAVDWTRYYRNEARRRVSLPLYPFEWQHYEAVPAAVPAQAIDWFGRVPDMASWFYEPTWKGTAHPAREPEDPASSWLVFLDDAGLGAAVANRLPNVTTVAKGTAFARYGDRAFGIRPEVPGDYEALWAEIEAPSRVLHFWSVDPAPAEGSSVFFPLLYLARRGFPRVDVISTGAWAVTGNEPIEPAKALVAGPCRVAPMELPGVRWRNIDVEPGNDRAVEQIAAECLSGPTDPVVAYRGRRRFTEALELVPLALREETPLRHGGVYLITGGMGGIGLAIAEFLAREYRARLVLVGRTPPSQDSISFRKIAAIEEVGGEVLVCAADVSDVGEMRSVLVRTSERFGALNGVIHAAGSAGGGLLQLKDDAMAEAVLAPKVRGTLVLDDLLRSVCLDFLVVFSSLASLLGGVGQVDYCSANAFLDAYSQREARRRDRLTVSIGWDTWAEIGMAANAKLPASLEAHRFAILKNALSPAEGVEAFRRALGSGLSQVCVSTLNLHVRVAQARAVADGRETTPPLAENSGQRHRRPDIRTAFAPATTEMERMVEKIWQDLFDLDRVGVADNFFDLGGHSLLATQMAIRVRAVIGIEIGVRDVFEAPTVAELAAVLGRMADESAELARMLQLVEQMSDEQAKAQLEQH